MTGYTFELRPLRNPVVLEQLAEALQVRSQMLAHPLRRRGALSPKERLQRKKRRYRVYLTVLILLGLPLLALGLSAPVKELGALAGGAALTACCGVWLWLGREPRGLRSASSEQLMSQVSKAERAGARVVFSEGGMSIRPARGGEERVPYRDIRLVFVLSDLMVLTGAHRAVVLQALELTWGDWNEFHGFLAPRVDELIDLRKRK